MKKIMRLFRMFRAAGTVDVTQRTVERELMDVGYEFERSRRNGESLSREIRDRYFKALKWAKSARFGWPSVNYYLREGVDQFRAEHR
jgi:hypothetical protein